MDRHPITVSRLMAVVAFVALDLGLLLNNGFGANPFQVVTVAVVEVGLGRAVLRGREGRAWWIGFAVAALVYVAIDVAYHYEIRYTFIDFCQLALLKPLAIALLVAIPLPEPLVFALLIGVLQVAAANLVGILGGRFAHGLAGSRRAIPPEGGPHQVEGPPTPPA